MANYHSYRMRSRRQKAETSILFEEEEEEPVDNELLRVIRRKLKKVNYSLEFECGGFLLLDEKGYWQKKGTLEEIDSHCIIYDIYSEEDRSSSAIQIKMEKSMQKYYGNLLAERKLHS